MNEEVCEKISNWLDSYLEVSGLQTFVVGVSGGIDSAVTSTLCARTSRPTIVLNIPINSSEGNTALSTEQCNWLAENYDNVKVLNFDLSSVYETFKSTVLEQAGVSDLGLANTKSRLRMVLLYYLASVNKGIVVGTGNKVEDFGVGFYTKYGDGGVDVSPIADFTKTQVRQLASVLNVPAAIIEAPPTDGLWEDGRTDQDQIGASYEELEWAMDYVDNNRKEDVTDREKEVLELFLNYRNNNRHKMLPIPIFSTRENL